LIQGYAKVNVTTVWAITQRALPDLSTTVQLLMDELAEQQLKGPL